MSKSNATSLKHKAIFTALASILVIGSGPAYALNAVARTSAMANPISIESNLDAIQNDSNATMPDDNSSENDDIAGNGIFEKQENDAADIDYGISPDKMLKSIEPVEQMEIPGTADESDNDDLNGIVDSSKIVKNIEITGLKEAIITQKVLPRNLNVASDPRNVISKCEVKSYISVAPNGTSEKVNPGSPVVSGYKYSANIVLTLKSGFYPQTDIFNGSFIVRTFEDSDNAYTDTEKTSNGGNIKILDSSDIINLVRYTGDASIDGIPCTNSEVKMELDLSAIQNSKFMIDISAPYIDSNGDYDTEQNVSESHKILEGNNQIWRKSSGSSLAFIVEGEIADFTGITVDNASLEDGEYTVSEVQSQVGTIVAFSNDDDNASEATISKLTPSIRVSLAPEYLETLQPGIHNMKAVFNTGSADARFTVIPSQGDSGIPGIGNGNASQFPGVGNGMGSFGSMGDLIVMFKSFMNFGSFGGGFGNWGSGFNMAKAGDGAYPIMLVFSVIVPLMLITSIGAVFGSRRND